MGLSRERILGAKPVEELVYVASLDDSAIVRGMTGAQRDDYEASCLQGRGKNRELNLKGMRAKLVAFCTYDEQGKRLFTDADVDALGDVRADVVSQLFVVASRLSGLSEADVEALGKSTGKTEATAISSSSSPENSATPSAIS